MGVLTMTKESITYINQKHIREWWCELRQELIQAAGEEGRNMAIDTNSFHHNVPAIILIIDSGWSKDTQTIITMIRCRGCLVLLNKNLCECKKRLFNNYSESKEKDNYWQSNCQNIFYGHKEKFCSICTRANNTTSTIPD